MEILKKENLVSYFENGIKLRNEQGRKPLRKLIIHCSASTFGDAALIDAWHKQRGFSEIGYNLVVLNGLRSKYAFRNEAEDGLIETGRALTKSGAHVEGQNHNSVGVCLIGTSDKVVPNPTDVFTYAQLDSLKAIIEAWHQATGLDIYTSVYGHSDFTYKKICPCFDVSKWLRFNDFAE